MQTPLIALTLAGTGATPRVWTSSHLLRIGRLPELEIAVDDISVSRLHAEVSLADGVWVIRDRGSSNGTSLNGVRIGRTPQPLHKGDVIEVGHLKFHVSQLHVRPTIVRLGQQTVQIEAAKRRWIADPLIDGTSPVESTGADFDAFLRLLRYSHRLADLGTNRELLQALINEATTYFQARRGGLFLLNDATGQFTLQCYAVRDRGTGTPRPPGKTLATLALRRRQSLLFQDSTEVAQWAPDSVARGEMRSIMCVLLRTPDREIGVLHFDRGLDDPPFGEADLNQADFWAANVALGLDRHQLVETHDKTLVQLISTLAQAVEMRDPYTGNHTQRVTAYALILAEELGLGENDRRQIRIATLLHDIGKIAIDDQILRKPGRLSDREFAIMQTHVLRGWEMIQMIPALASALPVIRGHHERWDGQGYPDGLAGEDIPLTARIVAVADAFDAMTSDRPYRAAMPLERALGELQTAAGTHFDPTCVAAFLRARPKIERVLELESFEKNYTQVGSKTLSRAELERERRAAENNLTNTPVVNNYTQNSLSENGVASQPEKT